MIFLSYRSGPHSIAVSAIAERLGRHFGPDQVFFDARLHVGSRYPDELRAWLDNCEVLVAVIHREWTDEFAEQHHKRLDWVEFEIATALAAGKTVIPLLLEDAEPPAPERLPESIAELGLRQAAKLRTKHFSSDVQDLVVRLEHQIVQSSPAPATDGGKPARDRSKRRAAVTKVVASIVVVWLLSLSEILESELPLWQDLMTSALLWLALAIPGMLMVPALVFTQRPPHRIQRTAGALPFRRYVIRSWGIFALLTLLFVLTWQGMVRDVGADGNWRTLLSAVGVIGFVYWIGYCFLRQDAKDRAWPPEVTTRPAVFRRAVWRLHERLTTWPDWRSPRTRAQQQQAVSVYLSLVEARLELAVQKELCWRRWLSAGLSETGLPFYYIGMGIAVAGQVSVACVIRLNADGSAVRVLVASVAVLLVVAAMEAAVIALDLWVDRKHRGWRIEELLAAQNRLGPLVFVQDAGR